MINDYDTFDQSKLGQWWVRFFVVPSVEELGIVLCQDHLAPVESAHFNTATDLNLGFVIANNYDDISNQLSNPTFSREYGDSLVLRRLNDVINKGQLVEDIVATAKERRKDRVVVYGEDLAFDNAICDMLATAGMTEQRSKEGRLLRLDV